MVILTCERKAVDGEDLFDQTEEVEGVMLKIESEIQIIFECYETFVVRDYRI